MPAVSEQLFKAKAQKKLTFEQIAQKLGRSEVWIAALFYGQAKPEQQDIKMLASVLDLNETTLDEEMGDSFYPDKGKLNDMPPKDPLIYRLYEIVANYGYAYKSVINEKFGDGIVSAIAFETSIEREDDKEGNPWVKIIQKGNRPLQSRLWQIYNLGKFLPYKRF